MSDAAQLASMVLAFEGNPAHRTELMEFCQRFNLKGVIVSHQDHLLKTLEQNINIGVILLCDEGKGIDEIILKLTDAYPEIPMFIRSEEPACWKDHQVKHPNSVVQAYQTGNFEALQQLLSDYLFNRIYPEGLVEKLQEIAREAILSRFTGICVDLENTFLASDKRIFGERIELMSVRSNWCEGVMMLQSNGSDIDRLVRAGRTSFPKDDEDVSIYTEDILRELMNQIWGGFKQRFVPVGFTGRPSNIEVPMTINHLEKYISFGATDPLLCFKFDISDGNSSDDPEFETLPLFLKFSFHLYWNVSDFTENAEAEEMIEAGELELF